MDIMMGLPTFISHGRKEELAWYRKIDEGPWSGLAICDRLVHSGWALSVQLAAAAAMTERAQLWTAIAALPLRNPVLFAKELATIDVLSGGRLTLGVGIGGYEEDYEAIGEDLALPRQRLDEQVAIMRKIWLQEPPVDGFGPIGPAPVQKGGVPLVAGVMGPKAMARVAKWANGVNDPSHTGSLDGEILNAQREKVVKAWKDAGRTDRPHFSTCVYFALGANAKQQLVEHMLDFYRPLTEESISYANNATNYGEAGLRNAIDGARAAGLDNIILMPTTADPSEIDRARDALGL